MDIRPFKEYRELNKFRNGQGYVLDIPEMDADGITRILRTYNEKYEPWSTNCTAPIQEALRQRYGFGARGTPTYDKRSLVPPELRRALLDTFPIREVVGYPQGGGRVPGR